jgi:hypothetical protein
MSAEVVASLTSVTSCRHALDTPWAAREKSRTGGISGVTVGASPTVYVCPAAERECLRKLLNVTSGAVGSEERCDCKCVCSHSLGELLSVGP